MGNDGSLAERVVLGVGTRRARRVEEVGVSVGRRGFEDVGAVGDELVQVPDERAPVAVERHLEYDQKTNHGDQEQ